MHGLPVPCRDCSKFGMVMSLDFDPILIDSRVSSYTCELLQRRTYGTILGNVSHEESSKLEERKRNHTETRLKPADIRYNRLPFNCLKMLLDHPQYDTMLMHHSSKPYFPSRIEALTHCACWILCRQNSVRISVMPSHFKSHGCPANAVCTVHPLFTNSRRTRRAESRPEFSHNL